MSDKAWKQELYQRRLEEHEKQTAFDRQIAMFLEDAMAVNSIDGLLRIVRAAAKWAYEQHVKEATASRERRLSALKEYES